MVDVEIFETMRFVRVEVPAESVPPTVTFPALSTANEVVDAELMTSNALTPLVVFVPQTESRLYGVVVPMPIFPVVEAMKIDDVAASVVPSDS